MKQYYVYILASNSEKFYIWVTSDLVKRVWEHKNKLVEWFTQKYNIDRLLYYEVHTDIYEAIKREKLIKRWKRDFKKNVILEMNPWWVDLYNSIIK